MTRVFSERGQLFADGGRNATAVRRSGAAANCAVRRTANTLIQDFRFLTFRRRGRPLSEIASAADWVDTCYIPATSTRKHLITIVFNRDFAYLYDSPSPSGANP